MRQCTVTATFSLEAKGTHLVLAAHRDVPYEHYVACRTIGFRLVER